jgi:hypothetical protein
MSDWVSFEENTILVPKEKIACITCELKSYRVGGVRRCIAWKRFKTVIRCSDYKGPKADLFLFDLGEGKKDGNIA